MRRNYIKIAVLAAAVIAIQLMAYVFNVNYYLTQLTMSAYYAVVAIGLCMLMGYAGQISLGHAGFFAIGGYTTAVLTTTDLSIYSGTAAVKILDKIGFLVLEKNIYGNEIFHVYPWISCIAAVVITIIIAYVIGIPVLSLKGHYLAMATLGFGTIVYRIVLGSKIFGEADGISNIPGFTIIPGITVSGNFSLRIQNYYFAWFLVIIGMIILTNLINSRVGRALRSLHSGDETAGAIGINTAGYKLKVFILSAVFASIAGIFLTVYNGGIGPSEASTMKSVRYVAIVAVGGMANIWGTLIAGLVLNFLSLRGVFGTFDDAVFGIVLILVMLFAPDGFLNINLKDKVYDFLISIKKSQRNKNGS